METEIKIGQKGMGKSLIMCSLATLDTMKDSYNKFIDIEKWDLQGVTLICQRRK